MYKVIIALLFIVASCNEIKPSDKVIFLQNEFIKIGILPDVGGRMVFYGKSGGENLLLSDSILWNEPLKKRITPSVNAAFKAYNGFITWVGPQTKWWSQQELIPQKKGDQWPPDPFLIYDNYSIKEITDTSIIIVGNASPVTGLQFTKQYVIDANSLLIFIKATNKRETEVSWDLWSNARFDAFSKFKIPVDSCGILKIQYQDEKNNEAIHHQLIDGFFSFKPELPDDPKKKRISKAFLYPNEGKMMIFKNRCRLTIEFDKVPQNQIHHEQALIETYNCVSSDGLNNILELEHHSAFTTLQAGESMELNEIWKLEY